MMKATVRMNVPGGLHLRPAQELCNLAIRFSSTVTMRVGDADYDVKSVLSVLGACVHEGTEVEFICSGEDEEFALQAMTEAATTGLAGYMRGQKRWEGEDGEE